MTKYTSEWALDNGLFGLEGFSAKNNPNVMQLFAAWKFDPLFGTWTWTDGQTLFTEREEAA